MRMLFVSSLVFASVSAAGAAQAQDRVVTPPPVVQVPPQVLPGIPTRPSGGATIGSACRVDPAFRSIVLTKNRSGSRISLRILVVNRGTSAWASAPGQAVVNWQLRNGSSGQVQGGSANLATAAGPGAVMMNYSTPNYTQPFDTFEFSGTVTASIVYDPDIAIDGNRCNDDRNMANNTVTLSSDQIQSFLAGTSLTRTFSF